MKIFKKFFPLMIILSSCSVELPESSVTQTPKSYSITYLKNDDLASGEMTKKYFKNEYVILLDKCLFFKKDWTFEGWSLTQNGPVDYLDQEEIKNIRKNIVLYAVWSQYVVQFFKNDDNAVGVMANQGITNGLSAPLNNCGFTKSGWSFAGWSSTPDGSIIYQDQSSVTMTGMIIKLYAQWTVNINTLHFEKNHLSAQGEMEDLLLASGSTISQLPECNFTNKGYTFLGWAESPAGAIIYSSFMPGKFTMKNSDMVLFAVWRINSHYVNYIRNDYGAEGSMRSELLEYGSYLELNYCWYSKRGWTFSGWSLTPDGDIIIDYNLTLGDSDINLYAKWTAPSTYKIKDRGPAGGWIFYDKGYYSDGWRYLEAAVYDNINSIWSNVNVEINGATGRSLGDGKQNTIDIVLSDPGTNTAAYRCYSYSLVNNGILYDDWYLPSIEELHYLSGNLYNKLSGDYHNLAENWSFYWSSTKTMSGYFKAPSPNYEAQSGSSEELRVRAIRYF